MEAKQKYYKFTLRVSEDTFKLVKQLSSDTGLSEREILAYSSQPCSPCSEFVIPYNPKNPQCETAKIPRGILFTDLLTKYGSYKRHGDDEGN